jgi:hypothetical protein
VGLRRDWLPHSRQDHQLEPLLYVTWGRRRSNGVHVVTTHSAKRCDLQGRSGPVWAFLPILTMRTWLKTEGQECHRCPGLFLCHRVAARLASSSLSRSLHFVFGQMTRCCTDPALHRHDDPVGYANSISAANAPIPKGRTEFAHPTSRQVSKTRSLNHSGHHRHLSQPPKRVSLPHRLRLPQLGTRFFAFPVSFRARLVQVRRPADTRSRRQDERP